LQHLPARCAPWDLRSHARRVVARRDLQGLPCGRVTSVIAGSSPADGDTPPFARLRAASGACRCRGHSKSRLSALRSSGALPRDAPAATGDLLPAARLTAVRTDQARHSEQLARCTDGAQFKAIVMRRACWRTGGGATRPARTVQSRQLRARWQAACARRQTPDPPVQEATARGIGIEDRQREPRRSWRWRGPSKGRRDAGAIAGVTLRNGAASTKGGAGARGRPRVSTVRANLRARRFSCSNDPTRPRRKPVSAWNGGVCLMYRGAPV